MDDAREAIVEVLAAATTTWRRAGDTWSLHDDSTGADVDAAIDAALEAELGEGFAEQLRDVVASRPDLQAELRELTESDGMGAIFAEQDFSSSPETATITLSRGGDGPVLTLKGGCRDATSPVDLIPILFEEGCKEIFDAVVARVVATQGPSGPAVTG
jgi:hypothetical protein